MTIVRGSRTKRKSRSNVESDLRISNNKNVLITNPPTNIGSLSFFIEKTANLGRIFTKGATTINVSDIIGNVNEKKHVVYNDDGFIYTNGIKVSAHTKDFTLAGDITIGNGGGNNEDYTISQIHLFNDTRSLTLAEIIDIYDSAGKIPESLHDITLPHYPLTLRYGFKADAAFIVKHTQFALNDHVVFDSVEQYNYSKASGAITAFADGGGGQVVVTSNAHGRSNGDVLNITDTTNYNGTFTISAVTANTYEITDTWVATETGNWNQFLSANHAELVNFTDDELGAVNPSTQSVNKEFYPNKGILNWGALYFLGMTDELTFASNTNWNNTVVEGTAVLALDIPGMKITVSTLGYVSKLQIRDISNVVLSEFNFNEFEGTFINDIVGANDATLVNWTVAETSLSGGAWVESQSLIPEIKQGFQLSGNSLEVNSFPSSSKGYTFVFDMHFPNPTLTINEEWLRVNGFADPNLVIRNNSVNDILRIDATNGASLQTILPVVPSGLSGKYDQISSYVYLSDGTPSDLLTSIAYNGVNQPNSASGSVSLADLSGLTAIFFARNTTPAFDLNATILRVRVYDRKLNNKELKRIYNNSLLSNTVNDPVLDYQFNEGGFSENGVNVIIKNHGSSGGANDGKFRGLTGGTTALQLTDVPNHLVNIDDLR